MGVYMFMETIKNSKNRLDLKQLDSDDLTLPKIQGGYIWKFEWMAAEEPILPCTGPAATCWNYLEVADPSPLQPQQRDWLRGHIQEFNDVLHSWNFADPTTGYRKYIDVDSFIDLSAAVTMVGRRGLRAPKTRGSNRYGGSTVGWTGRREGGAAWSPGKPTSPPSRRTSTRRRSTATGGATACGTCRPPPLTPAPPPTCAGTRTPSSGRWVRRTRRWRSVGSTTRRATSATSGGT
jgi:hypothetical protein